MQLITKAIAKKLPTIGANDNRVASEIKVPLKLFDPCGNWTWYVTEHDITTGEMFGFVVGLENELGSFDFNELSRFRNRMGLPLERDRMWDPNTTLQQVMDMHK